MTFVVTHPSPNSERLLQLNCFVLGDDPSCVFPVKIAATESVGTLRKLIKDEKKPELDHVAAGSLRLWNVSIPVDESFGDSLKKTLGKRGLPENGQLSAVTRLSKIFREQPDDGQLHIVIKHPPACKLPSTIIYV